MNWDYLTKPRVYLSSLINRARNRNYDFTIISNDCWGGEMYKDLGIEYKTPFIGVTVMAPCFVKLLQNLDGYLEEKLLFTKESKYNISHEDSSYPIGVLNDIEIHFFHYKSEEEAFDKWNRRLARVNKNNLFIKFDGSKDFANDDHIKLIDSLPFKNKVVFTNKDYKEFNSSVYLSNWTGNGAKIYKRCFKHFDPIRWINNKGTKSNIFKKFYYALFIKPL